MSVAALPGGGKLVELIERATADPGAISAIAQRWREAATTVESSGTALTGAVTGVDGAWQGAAADSFVTYLDGLVRVGAGARTLLATAAGVLDQMSDLLTSTRETVVNRCDALLAEVGEIRADLSGGLTQQEIDAVLALVVDEVHADLLPIVDGADQQLAGLAGRLQPGAAGFGAYPEPGTAAFVPTPGQPIDWRPEATEPASTTPSSSMSSSTPSSSSTGGGGGGGGGDTGGSGGGGGGGYGPSGPPPPGGGPAPQGQVAEWIQQAIEILQAQGYPVEKMNPDDIWMIIQHESGGNPNAINNWDSNADKGTPSKGLMQTIDPTFSAHALPGHGNIYNPVDNIIAGVRYAIDRYGSVSEVPGVVGVKNGTGYRGY